MCELLLPPNRIPVADPFIKCHEDDSSDIGSPQYMDDSYEYLNFSTDSLDRVIFQLPVFQSDSTLEYSDQMCSFMQEMEEKSALKNKEKHPTILTSEERVSVIEWMFFVCLDFGLLDETFFVATTIFDKIVQGNFCEFSEVQICGATALWIAAKLHETQIPSVEDFVAVCGDAYSVEEFCNFEKKILSSINYNIFEPTAENFTSAFLNQIPVDPSFIETANMFAHASLYSDKTIYTKPSHTGLAAITLAKVLLDYPMNLIVIPRSIPSLDDTELENATKYILESLKVALANTSGPFVSKFADLLHYNYINIDDLTEKINKFIETHTLSMALE